MASLDEQLLPRDPGSGLQRETPEKFNPQSSPDQLEFYSELKDILEQQREVESADMPLMFKLNIYLRQLLWQTCTNKLIFYSLYDQQSILMNSGNLSKVPLATLVYAAAVSQTENIVFAMMFVNFAFNANVISMVLPLSVCYYAILENPKPSYKYWKLVTSYMLVVIFLKFIVQLPFFCSSPVFGFWNCQEQDIEPELLVRRIDFIVGLQKYSGPASYPRDIGIFRGIVWDLLLLVMLVNLKGYLVMTGQWHFVRNDNNIHKTPKYKSRFDQKTEREKSELRAAADFLENQYPQMTALGKLKHHVGTGCTNACDFFFKLQPRYMPRVQANLDMRTQLECPAKTFNALQRELLLPSGDLPLLPVLLQAHHRREGQRRADQHRPGPLFDRAGSRPVRRDGAHADRKTALQDTDEQEVGSRPCCQLA